MLAVFLEGVGEILLPCSIGMVVPGLAAVLLGWWRSALAFVVFALAAAGTAWLRAADIFATDVDWVLGSMVFAAVLIAWFAWRTLIAPIGAAMFLGFFAGSTWRPCVGEELAAILNGAPQQPVEQLLPMTLYVTGVLVAIGALAVVPMAWPELRLVRPRVAPVIGTIIAVGLGIAELSGRYGEVLSEFAQLTVR